MNATLQTDEDTAVIRKRCRTWSRAMLLRTTVPSLTSETGEESAEAAGDLTLTPLGETFTEGSILARKELFATRLRRLPFFRWMLHMLQASSRGSLPWDVFLAALEVAFPAREAERHLNTALDWGRYAEIFGYDDAAGRVYLEQLSQTSL